MKSQPRFDVSKIQDLLEDGDGSLMNVLERIQARYRYLPEDALILVSERLGVPLSQTYSVATFYNAFSLQPKGRHIINVCLGTACAVRGSRKVLDRISDRLGIGPGETTKDGEFTLETVNCLGACALGPIVVVDSEYHGQMNSGRADALLREVMSEGEGS
ncbi:MAG: NAD(P)H-dependent oxidoreductase subunit E [Anaerolineae bacterium]|nr:NAD(P)H-dependent oxidoreductase subunit E [Anaerolineae bacterium]